MTSAQYATQLVDRALTDAEVEICIAIIKKGEAVDVDSAREELPLATAVALTRRDGQIVGIGAIKRKRLGYAKKVSDRADFSFPNETLELGYVAIDPAHRGHRQSHAIVSALLIGRDGELFATTSSDQMKRTLSNAGFAVQGKEWDGSSSRLTLWLRPTRLST